MDVISTGHWLVSDLKCDCVPQSCWRPPVLCTGPLNKTSCSCQHSWTHTRTAGLCLCLYLLVTTSTETLTATKSKVCSENSENHSNVRNRNRRSHTLVPYLWSCVYVSLSVMGVCLEGFGGLGTMWKSYWASFGSSQSHGKQLTKNNSGCACRSFDHQRNTVWSEHRAPTSATDKNTEDKKRMRRLGYHYS